MLIIRNIPLVSSGVIVFLSLVSAIPQPQGMSLVRRLPESVPAVFVLNYGRLKGRSPDDDDDDGDEGGASNDFQDFSFEDQRSGTCPEPDQYVCPDNIRCCKNGYSCGSANSNVCVRDPNFAFEHLKSDGHKKAMKTIAIVAGVIVTVLLIVCVVVFCCICRAGGKFYRKRKAAKPSPIVPAAYVGVEPKEDLNHPNQSYYQDQSQRPFTPNSAFHKQTANTTYPQHAPPPPSPGQFYPSRNQSSPYDRSTPPYGAYQQDQSYPLLNSSPPPKGGPKGKHTGKHAGNAAHVDIGGFSVGF